MQICRSVFVSKGLSRPFSVQKNFTQPSPARKTWKERGRGYNFCKKQTNKQKTNKTGQNESRKKRQQRRQNAEAKAALKEWGKGIPMLLTPPYPPKAAPPPHWDSKVVSYYTAQLCIEYLVGTWIKCLNALYFIIRKGSLNNMGYKPICTILLFFLENKISVI